MRRLIAFVFTVLAAIQTVRTEQAPVPQQPSFRSAVDLVQIDVSVLGKDRRPVKGLTAADFTIFEDGKRRDVATFAFVDAPDPELPAAGWMRTIPADVSDNHFDDRQIVAV